MSNRYVKLGIAVLALLCLLLCGCASAQGEVTTVDFGSCGESVTWKLDSAGTLTISGTGPMRDYSRLAYILPPWHPSYESSIKTVVIADGVTSIGYEAFYGCSNLTRVAISNSVTSIGGSAFYSCSSLTGIAIPGSVTSIGGSAFYDCSSLTSITIPGSVTDIGASAFSGCSGLTRIAIPNSLTSISSSAFSNCSGLTSIAIPNSVTSIGEGAFSYCSGLTSIAIPDSVTSIGGSAFSNCSGLTRIAIPDSVTSIGGEAFSYCSGLTSIAIPEGVTSIGPWTFSNCSSLTGIVIPDGVTSIGHYAFANCSSLTGIAIPDSVTSIGDQAFLNCDSLTGITIPDGVSSIGYETFYGCNGLTSIAIPDSVTSIGDQAFYGCSGLTGITIPGSVTSISNEAFKGCSGLTSVTIPDGVTSIGNEAFSGCSSLTGIAIPDGVTNIGYDAFWGCSSLTDITIPNGVTSIGSSAFQGCSGLTGITIPDGVTSIGSSAFQGCNSLTRITIPDSVTSIGYSALYCANLDRVLFEGMDMPAMGTIVFQGMPTIYCFENSEVDSWAAENGYRREYLGYDFNIAVPELWIVRGESAKLEINREPANANAAFAYASSDETILSVDGTGAIAAKNPGDATVTVSADNGLVRQCKVHVCYPVTAVAFAEPNIHMSEGESIPLTANVTAQTQSFVNKLVRFTSGDEAIATVDEAGVVSALHIGTVTITARAASGTYATCEITVGCKVHGSEAIDPAVPATHATTGWTEGRHCSVCNMVLVPQEEIPLVDVPIVSLSASLTVIEDQAFYGDAFQCVVIPDGCKRIGAGAFESNTALRFVEIPASVEFIDASAFKGCSRDLIFVTTSGSAAEAYAARNSIVCISVTK